MWRKHQVSGKPLCNKCELYVLRYGTDRPLVNQLKCGKKRKFVNSMVGSTCSLLPTATAEAWVNAASNGCTCSTGLTTSNACSQACLTKKKKQEEERDQPHGKEQKVASITAMTTRSGACLSSTPQLSEIIHGQESGGWSSLSALKDRLQEAAERYPDIIHTFISIVRKHVLTQPQVVSRYIIAQTPVHEEFTMENHSTDQPLMEECLLRLDSSTP
ncbi:hypothetical protein C9374_007237 [Naegleria lovaniensis]|uniref:GATA-type domain-containing protein n=1 Tax=Naegleria lovaniensis TaxID=51637 RepID=A0AA88H4S0_NAELO|nr:uncharacterized protein C9374_007237 [Naegleria lovaniensis]KAG2393706.1 hypothetical protein C9374_007237 [Naegleria lovaniensis]